MGFPRCMAIPTIMWLLYEFGRTLTFLPTKLTERIYGGAEYVCLEHLQKDSHKNVLLLTMSWHVIGYQFDCRPSAVGEVGCLWPWWPWFFTESICTRVAIQRPKIPKAETSRMPNGYGAGCSKEVTSYKQGTKYVRSLCSNQGGKSSLSLERMRCSQYGNGDC